MKKQKIIFTSILLITILAVSFAGFKIYKNIKKPIDSKDYKSTASTTRTVEEKYISSKNSFYEITAKYPSDSLDKSGEIANFINAKIKEKEEEWKIGGQIWSDEQTLNKLYPDRPIMKYTYDISYKFYESKDHHTTSYVFNIYEFTGGAHGNSTVYTYSFDNNEKLDIEKILNLANNNNDIALSRILADNILKSSSDIYNKDMVMDGLGLAYLKSDGKTFDKAKCDCDGFFFGSNFQKFYITDKGITFLFNQYEVAPGAAGVVEVNLPWYLLKPYLINPDF